VAAFGQKIRGKKKKKKNERKKERKKQIKTMEGQSVKVVAVMATFVMIYLGQATVRFDKCYAKLLIATLIAFST
jgi:ABC-type transporter Mla maintaining outer membrane lipid asymmetry permease subunit MlaE